MTRWFRGEEGDLGMKFRCVKRLVYRTPSMVLVEPGGWGLLVATTLKEARVVVQCCGRNGYELKTLDRYWEWGQLQGWIAMRYPSR